jgi:hypothetical protein
MDQGTRRQWGEDQCKGADRCHDGRSAAAINDGPMGALTFEDEVFDLARLQTVETT